MPIPTPNPEKLTLLGRKTRLFAAKGPAYHLTYGRWRLNNWLQKISTHTFYPDDNTFLNQLDLKKPELTQVKQALVEQDNNSALTRLTTYFRARKKPAFFFDHKDIQKILPLIDNNQKKATIRTADEICQNTFCFRQVAPVQFQDGIDWTYRPHENTDWTWDLNRHTYFETLGRAYWYTGDERYGQKFRELVLDWLAKNPAHVSQSNWASVFEVACRINTWIWAFYYFRSATAFNHEVCLALLKGLLAHGRYLNANLELHALNNHLLLEAKALALLGTLFPEFQEAKKWQHRGLRILYQQVKAQVCSDGVHSERTTHYHRVIGGELLELLVLLENNDIPIPLQVIQALDRMTEFELWITKPDGQIPLLGDSALEDTHMRFSAVRGGPPFLGRSDLKSVAPPPDEASIWLLGPGRVEKYLDLPTTATALNSRAFPSGGYFVMRQGQSAGSPYLAFDCGPFGHKPVPVHGHADALSFELYAFGQTMVIDPGIYSTHLGQEWRHFFRGTRAHNTVVVDGQDQSILLDSRRVYRPAQATLHQWISSEHFDFADGSHNGYERLADPIAHRRQIFFARPEYWVVVDLLSGRHRHCFDLYFHLMPGTEPCLHPRSGSLHTTNGSGPGLFITPLAATNLQADLITGANNPIQGWVSFLSGEKWPAPTLRYRQEAMAPVQFCTVLYPYPAGGNVPLTVSPLQVGVQDQLPADENITSLQIETASHIDYLILDRGSKRARKVFAQYETDAQLFYGRHKKGETFPTKVILRGGKQILFRGQSLLQTEEPIPDLILDRKV